MKYYYFKLVTKFIDPFIVSNRPCSSTLGPAEIKGSDGLPEIQCDRCQLCAKDRKAIIAFHAHGKYVKKVNARLKVLNDSSS